MKPVLSFAFALFLATVHAGIARGQLVNSEWNTGNGDWNVATNWFPNDVPDNGGGLTYAVQIGNRPVAAGAQVTFVPEDGTGDSIDSLVVSSAADLFTNGNQVFVAGQTTVDGVGTTIRVDPHTTPGTFGLDTDNLDLNGGGAIVMNGGILNVDILMEINAGGVLSGFGLVNVGDFDAVVETVFENSSLIQLAGSTITPETLTLQTNGVDRLDLDGTTETGVVDVANVSADLEFDTLTLVVDSALSDAFSGTLQIGQRDTVTFNDDFTMSGADVQLDGGTSVATINGPAAVTSIDSSIFTITGDAAITNNMTFSGVANTITVNAASSLSLGGTVTIPDASAVIFTAASSELFITGAVTINEAAGDFNWDGPSTASTTISGSGLLSITVDQVDTGNDIYGGTLNLNDNADVSVNNTANEWTAAGTINKNNAGTSSINGDRVLVTGNINVNAGTLDMPATTLTGTADVTVNGILTLGATSDLAGPTTLNGPGTLRMEGTSTVSANTTVNVATFDWDGLGSGTTQTINDGVVVTINSTTFDSDGDMDDPINLGGNGAQLVVSGSTEWTMNRTLTANTAAAGTATISGTSRMILSTATGIMNVDGNTTILAPVTFGASSTVSIDAAMTLNAQGNTIYDGGTISGAGTYDAGPINTVTANSTINVTNFNFDAGSWTIQNDVALTVNVGDYDPDSVPNVFNATINLIGGDMDLNTADASFVMDGTLNLSGSATQITFWDGEPVDIGNDAGLNNADMNATGNPADYDPIRFGAPVTFKSDADVHVADGAELEFWGLVVFDTVNGANNAEFTGDGIITFHEGANVNEAVTLNMVGGLVNLCGFDSDGDFVNIDAPLTINASTLTSFGKVNVGGGIDTLDVNNSVGTGTLTVNLDSANAEWTLDGLGVMNLVNDNAPATLLAGSDVNLNGTVNVTGDVRTDARVDIVGTVNINTAAEPFRLAGGDNSSDPNTLNGGTISGAGLIAADTGKALHGFGTINSGVDFDGTANLKADDGTLTINGAIIDVNTLGTADSDGVLNIPAAWNTSTGSGAGNIATVSLVGGTLQGGTITNDNSSGIQGIGTVTSRVINNTRILAGNGGGTLLIQTAANDNDWDGAPNTGELSTRVGATLELRDNNLFGFTGSVTALAGSTVFTNGFALDFNPGSTIELTGATYQSTNSTDIGGTVTVKAGPDSRLDIQVNRFLTLESTSVTTLNGNLRLVSNNASIQAGATFSGTGALIVPDNSHLIAEANANINVLLDNQGAFRPSGFDTVGRVDLKDYQQASTGELFVELAGTGLNQFDRLVINGAALLDGSVDVELEGGFVPVLGNTFNIISTIAGVSGMFVNIVQDPGMPVGLFMNVKYLPNIAQLVVVDTLPGDYNRNGTVDAADYVLWRNTLGNVVAAFSGADGNGSGTIDPGDYSLWRGNFGQSAGPGAGAGANAAVPEPTSLALLLLGMLAMSSRCRADRW